MIPYSRPPSYDRTFARLHPALHRRLREAEPGVPHWRDVEHWLWPLFSDAALEWRARALGLGASLPLDSSASPLVPLLYLFSERVVPRPGFWPEGVQVTGREPTRTCPTRCSSLCRRLQTTRAAVLLPDPFAGFVYPDDGADPIDPPPPMMPPLRDGPQPPTLAVDLGSMPALGLLPDLSFALEVLWRGCQLAGLRCQLITGGLPGWHESLPEGSAGALQLLAGPVSHDALLRRSCCVLHHGGSGTTAAALRSGVPQLVSPFLLDQFSWAGRMELLGVGCQLPGAHAGEAAARGLQKRAAPTGSSPSERNCPSPRPTR